MRKFIFIFLFPQLLTTKFRRRGSDLYNYFLLNIQVNILPATSVNRQLIIPSTKQSSVEGMKGEQNVNVPQGSRRQRKRRSIGLREQDPAGAA